MGFASVVVNSPPVDGDFNRNIPVTRMTKRTATSHASMVPRNPPSALATPAQADIPVLAPGELERLSVEYARTRDNDLRSRLVFYHQRLVRSIASRFLGSGESIEDLVQVGNIGLINALDRYNPAQGTRFSTYATPTILGEIKRHFRDKTAAIKVPRHLQEISYAARRATQQLTHQLGRTPLTAELAQHLGVSEEDVIAAQESAEAVHPLSLDTHFDTRAAMDSASMLDLVGRIDKTLHEFETYGDLRSAMASLGTREREVISLRFFDDLSQAKIAQRLNISQMHVSRLQQRALLRLREMLADDIRVGTVATRRLLRRDLHPTES